MRLASLKIMMIPWRSVCLNHSGFQRVVATMKDAGLSTAVCYVVVDPAAPKSSVGCAQVVMIWETFCSALKR